jgi:hypothetical protein
LARPGRRKLDLFERQNLRAAGLVDAYGAHGISLADGFRRLMRGVGYSGYSLQDKPADGLWRAAKAVKIAVRSSGAIPQIGRSLP